MSTAPASVNGLPQNDLRIATLLNELEALKASQRELEQKRYIDTGIAHFADLLRWKHDLNLTQWANQLLVELIPYVGGITGALYQVEREEVAQPILQRIGGYALPADALDVLQLGEGLSGQAALTGKPLHLNGQAEFTTHTRSSLTQVALRSLYILPLMYNDQVEGVLEVGATDAFGAEQTSLLEHLAQTLAANMNTVRNQIRIQRLWDQAEIKTQQLTAQEEELRQNLEELEATQEQLKHVNLELQEKEQNFRLLTANVPGMIYQFELGPEGAMSFPFVSDYCRTMFGMEPEAVVADPNVIFGKVPADELPVLQQAIAEAAQNMAPFDWTGTFVLEDRTIFARATSVPMLRANGHILFNGVIMDVSAARMAEAEMADKNRELMQAEEELRQNLEELVATQEAMKAAQRQVDEQKSLLDNLINGSNDTIMAIDRNFRVIFLNEQFTANYKAQGVEVKIGTDVLSLFLNEAEREQMRQLYHRAFAGESFVVEVHYDNFGIVMDFEVKYYPLRTPSGEVFAAAVWARDITERKNAERLQQATEARLKAQETELFRLTRLQATAADDLQAFFSECVSGVARTLGVTQVGLWLRNSFETSQTTLRALYNEPKGGLQGHGMELDLAAYPAYYEALQTRGTVPITDVYDAPETAELKAYFDAFQLKALLDATIRRKGQFEGMVCIEQDAVRAWKADEIQFAAGVAEQLALALEAAERRQAQAALEAKEQELTNALHEIQAQQEELRQNLEELEATQEQLKGSEMQLQRFLEALPIGVFIVQADGTPYYANKAATSILGQGIMPDANLERLGEIYETRLSETDKHYPVDQMPLVRALQGQSVTIDNMDVLRPQGRIRLEVTGAPVHDPAGNLTHALAVFTNITERKEVEKNLLLQMGVLKGETFAQGHTNGNGHANGNGHKNGSKAVVKKG